MTNVFGLVFLAFLASAHLEDHDEVGRVAYSKGQFRDAKVSFERAVRHFEGRPLEQSVALTNLGQTLIALEEWTAAGRALQRAVDLRPASARAWQYLGQMKLRVEDLAAAEQCLRKALSLILAEPHLEAACLSDLAELLKMKNDKPEALKVLMQAVSLTGPGQAKARMLKNLGVLHWELGSKKDAELALEQALRELEGSLGTQHPDVAQILEDYSFVLAKSGKKAQARESSVRAKKLRDTFGWQANTSGSAVDWRALRATRQ